MKIWLPSLCLAALTAASAHAMGIVAIKEQAFHEDSSATVFMFSEMIDGGAPFIKFRVGSKDFTFDRVKVAAAVEIPPSIPENIATPDEIKPLRTSLADLTSFSTRFPKSGTDLAPHIATLSDQVSRFDQGEVRHRGKWLPAGDYASLQATLDGRNAVNLLEEQRRQERIEILRAEKEKIATAQRAKGLVDYDGLWMTKEEAAKRYQSDREVATAEDLVGQRTLRRALYSVEQITPEGLLIAVQGKTGPTTVFLHGSGRASDSDGATYRSDLHWAGTCTYITVAGIQRTVNAYSLKRDDAVARALAHLRATSSTNAGGGKAMPNRAFDNVKSTGSGFFVGNAGHFVTNAHVVKDAASVEIYQEGKLLKAKVLATDTKVDLALLKVASPAAGLEIIADDAETGQDIYTIGFPRPTLQGTEVKITKGIISSRKGLLDDDSLYQLDASIQPGNSGGPVCDAKGRVLGVVVAMLDQIAVAQASGTIPQNVNYAIKSRMLITFLKANKIIPEAPATPVEPVEGTIKTATNATAMVMVK